MTTFDQQLARTEASLGASPGSRYGGGAAPRRLPLSPRHRGHPLVPHRPADGRRRAAPPAQAAGLSSQPPPCRPNSMSATPTAAPSLAGWFAVNQSCGHDESDWTWWQAIGRSVFGDAGRRQARPRHGRWCTCSCNSQAELPRYGKETTVRMFVAGGTGVLGRPLVEALVDRG